MYILNPRLQNTHNRGYFILNLPLSVENHKRRSFFFLNLVDVLQCCLCCGVCSWQWFWRSGIPSRRAGYLRFWLGKRDECLLSSNVKQERVHWGGWPLPPVPDFMTSYTFSLVFNRYQADLHKVIQKVVVVYYIRLRLLWDHLNSRK